ncbi:hypothetical protein Q8F55_008430 [Vanrija albida]|uniref:Pali-domain-containing protein n=1 Tax=Vanrija albida TaxID=181172 RepID=A0ABR3PQT2_9TREE
MLGFTIGSFFLFAATILLLVASLSPPTVAKLGFLNYHSAGTVVRLGIFGACRTGEGISNQCTARSVGYNLNYVIGNFDFSNGMSNATRAFVLHPVACGVSFIGFLIAFFSDRFGLIFSSLITFVAFVLSLICMAVDFAVFAYVRRHINNNVQGGSANWAASIWLVLAATILLFLAQFIVLFECCCGGGKKKKQARTKEVA